MKSKAKFLPLVVFAAVLVSLVFIIPVFSASGTVKFVDPTDNSISISWAKQGGTVTLEVTDSDLDEPIKRVLLPVDMEQNAATVTGSPGSALLQLSATSSASATATTTTSLIALDDTILVASSTAETVRKVTDVNMTTGVVTVNKPFVGDPDGSIYKVYADDASAAKCPTCAGAQAATSQASAGTQFVVLASPPIQDSGSSGSSEIGEGFHRFTGGTLDGVVVDSRDVAIKTGQNGDIVGITLNTVSRDTGLGNLTIESGDTSTAFFLVYWGAAANDTGTTVTVTSQADTTGIPVTLPETGPATGVFRLDILATSSDSNATPSSGDPQIKVGVNDKITLKYEDADPDQDATIKVTIESTEATFSNFLPANAKAGTDTRPEVSANIVDTDSGVDEDTIKIIFAMDTDADGDIENVEAFVAETEGDTTAITSGFFAKVRLPVRLTPTDDATIYWWVQATDVALNLAMSDRLSQLADDSDDVCKPDSFPTTLNDLIGEDPTLEDGSTIAAIASCQPFSILVDFSAPTVTSVITGPFFDTDADAIETDVAKAKNTSIQVVFSEDLDGTTVQAFDFTVDFDTSDSVAGIIPISADWFSDAKSSVFLSVAAMASNARPEVNLVGEVQDVAGNPQTAGTVSDAVDGIAPTLEVTITGTGASRPVTNGTITITIVADEDVSLNNQSVTINRIGDEDATGGAASFQSTSTPIAVLTATRTFEATFDPTTKGLYNVIVRATDATTGNTGVTGKTTGPFDLDEPSLFEFDDALPDPSIIFTSPDDPDTFVSISFKDEGTEYSSSGTGAADFDTHDTVTITAATLDGLDITPLETADNKEFLYKASGLAEGDHKIKVSATDTAGNTKTDFEVTIAVTARVAFELKLSPGWNLVSIPGEPADAAIDTVIPSTHPASTALTYDPSVPGGWLTAVRGGDGNWAGTLDTISAGRAYWMFTNSFESIDVDIPRLSSGASVLPPTIGIVTGWNFIPVLDVTGDLAVGATTTTTGYTSGLEVSRVWTFSTVTNRWVDVTTTHVTVGSGYWLYATKTGTLIP